MGIDPVSIAITIALNAAVMGLNAMQKIEGPRLADLTVTVADYGTPLNYIAGSRRVEVPCFYSEPIKETKTRRKTKTGKYSEYEYSGTFAVVVADHEVDEYERIWLDRRLAMDTFGGEVEESLNVMDYLRLYYGTSTQEPDERMLATVEAEEGAGTCPAYLDVAYIMAEELPLQPFGNRFPQVSVQVRRGGSSTPEGWVTEIVVDLPDPLPGLEPEDIPSFDHNIQLVQIIIRAPYYINGSNPAIGPRTIRTPIWTGGTVGVDEWAYFTYSDLFGWTIPSGDPIMAAHRYDSAANTLTIRYWYGPEGSNFLITVEGRSAGIDPAATLQASVTQADNGGAPATLAINTPASRQDYSDGGVDYCTSQAQNFNSNPNNEYFIEYLTAGSADVTLGSICERVALGANMAEEDFDFSDLTQPIPGYSWTQGAGKDIVGPLLELHDSDVRPNGFLLEGIRRGAAMVGSAVPYTDFVRTDEEQPAYEITLTSESDLPRRIFATYADIDSEQQPNTAVYQRSAESVLTRREVSIDLTTYASVPDDIQPLVERALRRRWIGDMRLTNALPPFYLDLLPGSVRDIKLEDDKYIRARVLQMEIAPNRVLGITWERDRESVPAPELERGEIDLTRTSPGAAAVGRPTPSLFQPVATQLFVLDVPLLTDADDRTVPFLLVGVAPVIAGDWPGADVQRSDSGLPDSFDPGFVAFSSAGATTWGTAMNALPDAIPGLMDEGSELILQLAEGLALQSVEEEAMLADQQLNQFILYGADRWEIGQFRDAVLQSEGEWRLTGLIRGQRGTERFTSTHQIGDTFLLAGATLARREIGATEIGDRDWYKSATLGVQDQYAEPISLLFAAEAHRPYAPAHLELVRDPDNGDWQITWLRRTRVGGSTFSGQNVPLGETSEQYRIRILNGETTVHTEDLTSPEFLYSSYEQVTDFGSEQLSLTVEVVQLSPSLGIEGIATRATA